MSRETPTVRSVVAAFSQRLFGVSPLRMVAGLAILGAIVGGLVLLDRGGSDASVGPLDDSSPQIGERAPQFALRNLQGEIVQLSDFEGRVVWINFWATWCGPCRRELPDIQRLAAEFEDDGLVVLAVNQGESSEKAAAFWKELGLDLPLLLDADQDVSDQYGLVGLPNSFFIDRRGVLQDLQLGFMTEGQMRANLTAAGIG